MKELVSHLKNYRKELILGPLFKLMEAIIEVFLPLFMAYLIDNPTSNLLFSGILMVGLILLGTLCAIFAQYLAAKTSQNYGNTIRDILFQKLLNLSSKDMQNLNSTSLVNRLTDDVTWLETGIAMFIRLVIRVPFLCISAFVMTFFLSRTIGFLLLFVTVLLGISISLVFRFSSPIHQKSNRFLDKLTSHVRENLTNVRIVRSLLSQKREQEKGEYWNKETYRSIQKAYRLSGLLTPISTILLNTTILIVLRICEVPIETGNLSEGSLIAIINYISQMLLAILVFSNLVTIYTKSYSSAKRIEEILETPSRKDTGTLQEITPSPIAIRFQNASFSYTNSKPFLENLDFEIKQGEIIGILGLTGSGKTTLFHLIHGDISCTNGEIYLFDKKLSEYTSSMLKEAICFLAQKPSFLSNTIFHNISISLTPLKEEVISALQNAEAWDFVKLFPEKTDHLLENEANNLSGGQKQRIALSRAFVRHSPILLLDDSTSALDFATEKKVLQHLEEKVKNEKTTILLSSQKLSTFSVCNRILVLSNGKIEGFGTSEELLHTSPTYQKLYQMQHKEAI